MFSFFNKVSANYTQLAHNFEFKGIDGQSIKISDYKEKVIVVVNVASRCGFTKQYEDLQNLWTNYKDNNLVVIGIPTNDFKQEPASNKAIKDFCETKFNIDFCTASLSKVIFPASSRITIRFLCFLLMVV